MNSEIYYESMTNPEKSWKYSEHLFIWLNY